MFARTILSAGTLALALTATCASLRAQDYASALPPERPLDAADRPDTAPLTADESAALGQALMFDPSSFALGAPAKPLRLPNLSQKRGFEATRTDNPDGSSAMVLKQPLPTEWDAKVGADLGLGPSAPSSYQPGRPLPGQGDRNSGAAWASLGVSHFATVDARIDPTNEQGRLGTTFKKSIPVGDRYSVTLQNSYAVTESFGESTSGPAGLPLTALPQDAGTAPSQVWSNEKQVKFNIASTGTTLGAGLASTSVDPVTHNRLSAEQKLYGPLQVTTAVNDLGQPYSSKSITAGFKLKW